MSIIKAETIAKLELQRKQDIQKELDLQVLDITENIFNMISNVSFNVRPFPNYYDIDSNTHSYILNKLEDNGYKLQRVQTDKQHTVIRITWN